ncbi:hypothetical protein C8Q73DRAFT_773505 [Cubamyces lactineus]|nr:hypothetical protein C8Q73DRAFT_773505 [Cubamyces lactineus]
MDSSRCKAMPPSGASRERLGWQDALAAAETNDRLWFVITPNMDYVPAPPAGVLEVVMREDFRYGIVDPIQWPQVYMPGHEYLCAIMRPKPNSAELGALWWTPREEKHFEKLEGTTIKTLGLLKPFSISPLLDLLDRMSALTHDLERDQRNVVSSKLLDLECKMCHAGDRLRSFPCTFRDAAMQVRLAQRYWLMCRAYLDFYGTYMCTGSRNNPLNIGLMGAFTTDPGVVQTLFEAGIPVWWLRQDPATLGRILVVRFTKLQHPVNICVATGPDHGHVLHRGLIGPKHFDIIAHAGHTYHDVSRAPLLVVESRGGYPPALSQQQYKQAVGPMCSEGGGDEPASRDGDTERVDGGHTSRAGHGNIRGGSRGRPQARGRKPYWSTNKFLEIEHEWMPPAITPWRRAMDAVDRARVGRPTVPPWSYWVPDPGLFLRAHKERAEHYVMTWLCLRSGWMYMLRLKDAERDFLYGDTGRQDRDETTRNAQRARQIMHVFRRAFEVEDVDMDPSVPPVWFSRQYPTIPASVCPQIIWEIHELGFRQELSALHRLLVPMRDQGQLEDKEERREDLSERVFPDRWPKCPQSIYKSGAIATNMSAEEIVGREEELARTYIQTFYDESGRAPIIPRAFPWTAEGLA